MISNKSCFALFLAWACCSKINACCGWFVSSPAYGGALFCAGGNVGVCEAGGNAVNWCEGGELEECSIAVVFFAVSLVIA